MEIILLTYWEQHYKKKKKKNFQKPPRKYVGFPVFISGYLTEFEFHKCTGDFFCRMQTHRGCWSRTEAWQHWLSRRGPRRWIQDRTWSLGKEREPVRCHSTSTAPAAGAHRLHVAQSHQPQRTGIQTCLQPVRARVWVGGPLEQVGKLVGYRFKLCSVWATAACSAGTGSIPGCWFVPTKTFQSGLMLTAIPTDRASSEQHTRRSCLQRRVIRATPSFQPHSWRVLIVSLWRNVCGVSLGLWRPGQVSLLICLLGNSRMCHISDLSEEISQMESQSPH